jgi:DASH complex subunit ASK1
LGIHGGEEEEMEKEGELGDVTDATTVREHNTFHDVSSFTSSPGHYSNQGENTGNVFGIDGRVKVEDRQEEGDLLDDSLLDDLKIEGQSTPKAKRKGEAASQILVENDVVWADVESPFETVRKKFAGRYDTGIGPGARNPSKGQQPPITPRRPQQSQETPESSPLCLTRPEGGRILHRALDKTYRLQATPMGKTAPPSRYRSTMTAATPKQPPTTSAADPFDFDSSPMSSPGLEPTMHRLAQMRMGTPPTLLATTRTPGTKKLFTTAINPTTTVATNPTATTTTTTNTMGKYSIDDLLLDDSDDDDVSFLMSPPKTIQFSMPRSKLLATPAKEASRRIVNDILRTAGASVNDNSMSSASISRMSSPGLSSKGSYDPADDDPF